MEIDSSVLNQLKKIAIDNGHDMIVEVGNINNKSVYLTTYSTFTGGKRGYPCLYSYDENSVVFELPFEIVRKVIKQQLFQDGGKVVQRFRIH